MAYPFKDHAYFRYVDTAEVGVVVAAAAGGWGGRVEHMQGEVTNCTLESPELISGKMQPRPERQVSHPPPHPPTCQHSGLKNWSVARAGSPKPDGIPEALLHQSQLMR